MISALYSEFRKIITVRSTYVVSILALLIIGFFSFYGSGYKGVIFAPDTLMQTAMQAISIVGIFVGILAIIHISHEYRYNTVGYTITASNSRLKVMLAKFTVAGAYGLLMTLLTIVLAFAMVMAGAALAGKEIGQQTIELWPLLWKSIFFMVSSAWFGLVLGLLSRSLAFSIVIYFFLPIVEQLLVSLLKVNRDYLPSAAQGAVLGNLPSEFSAAASAGVFSIYLVVSAVVAIVLFIRRDAN